MKLTLKRFFTVFATVVAVIYAVGAVGALKVAVAQQQGLLMPSAAKEVADITYYDAEATAFQLADLQGKVVVVHFWAKWCPPCIAELPEMEEALAALDAGDDLVVLPLSLDREVAVVEAFYAENNITLPVLMDQRGAAMRALEIRGLPGTVLLNREGKEIARRAGVVDWDSPAVRGVIEEALKP